MKQIISLSMVLVLAACLLLGGTAFADQDGTLPYYVSDTAGLLSEDEWQTLESAAARISEQYGCGVYLVTLADYREFGSYRSFQDFSEAFYRNYHMGLGDEHNGILLIMSMQDRDYWVLAYGSFAHYAFTDYGKERLESRFLDNFRRDDWTGGFSDYIGGCGEFLGRAAAGDPVDVSFESREGLPDEVSLGLIIGVPLLAGFGTCEGMRRRMKPVKLQSRADEYVVPGGINLSLKRDVFVNRTVTRTVIRSDDRDSSHHGGGGTTINSHGFSGHGGKF